MIRQWDTIRHNHTMHVSPSLSQKIFTSLLQLRFGKCLLLYDLMILYDLLLYAFIQVKLPEQDCNKLLFKWGLYDHFRTLGSWGMGVSTSHLGLNEPQICFLFPCSKYRKKYKSNIGKRLVHKLLHVYNGGNCGDNSDYLEKYYDIIILNNNILNVFTPYGFAVRQLYTDCCRLQQSMDSDMNVAATHKF